MVFAENTAACAVPDLWEKTQDHICYDIEKKNDIAGTIFFFYKMLWQRGRKEKCKDANETYKIDS